jgi:hypothetical protein
VVLDGPVCGKKVAVKIEVPAELLAVKKPEMTKE